MLHSIQHLEIFLISLDLKAAIILEPPAAAASALDTLDSNLVLSSILLRVTCNEWTISGRGFNLGSSSISSFSCSFISLMSSPPLFRVFRGFFFSAWWVEASSSASLSSCFLEDSLVRFLEILDLFELKGALDSFETSRSEAGFRLISAPEGALGCLIYSADRTPGAL